MKVTSEDIGRALKEEYTSLLNRGDIIIGKGRTTLTFSFTKSKLYSTPFNLVLVELDPMHRPFYSITHYRGTYRTRTGDNFADDIHVGSGWGLGQVKTRASALALAKQLARKLV
jgi:hypothetical protein